MGQGHKRSSCACACYLALGPRGLEGPPGGAGRPVQEGDLTQTFLAARSTNFNSRGEGSPIHGVSQGARQGDERTPLWWKLQARGPVDLAGAQVLGAGAEGPRGLTQVLVGELGTGTRGADGKARAGHTCSSCTGTTPPCLPAWPLQRRYCSFSCTSCPPLLTPK